MAELERGQIRISGEGPSPRPQGQRGGLIVLAVALVAIAAGYFFSDRNRSGSVQKVETFTVCGSGSVPGQNCISPPPLPPGRTVYFTPAAEGSTVAFAFLVTTRSFRVIRVARAEDIPNYSEARIIETGDVATERQLGRCRPCVIRGDVSIAVGPIVQQDAMAASIRGQDSVVETVQVKYRQSSPRGPPLEEPAVVFVIGEVKEFSGPDQFDKSRFIAGVDLGTANTDAGEPRSMDEVRREEEFFERRFDAWKAETALRFDVPTDRLERFTEPADVQALVKERSPGYPEHPVAETVSGKKAPSGERSISGERSMPRRGAHH